jgi:hypothetical protein
MLAMADARWASADSVASTVLATPATPAVFRLNAITAHASALAARGEVGAADSVLRMEANASTGAIARWYERARLLLAIAGDTPISRPPNLVPSDTTMPADMLRALWAAAAGDTASARKMLGRVNSLSKSSLAVVGNGPTLIEAMLAGDAGQWRVAADRIGPVALSGEFDPTMLDRPDSYLLRWFAAKAYANLGKPDSSAIFLTLMLSPTRMPPGHLALRGLAYAPTMRKLGLLRSTGLRRPFQQPTDGIHRSR